MVLSVVQDKTPKIFLFKKRSSNDISNSSYNSNSNHNYSYISYVYIYICVCVCIYIYIYIYIASNSDTTLKGRYHLSSFTDEGTEAQKDKIICLRLENKVGYIY